MVMDIVNNYMIEQVLYERFYCYEVYNLLIKTKCYVCRMDPPWITKARGKGSYTRGRGRTFSSRTSGSSYGSSSSSPIIQRGGMSLYNLSSRMQEKASSIHLEDISKIAKEDVNDIKTYEKVEKKEVIFLIENSDIQRREEPWKIFQRYLVNGLYFPVNIKTIYDYGWFDKISNKQLIKTTEQFLALNSSEQTIRLLNKRDIDLYRSQYKFLRIGMIQIAFKPLTLKGMDPPWITKARGKGSYTRGRERTSSSKTSGSSYGSSSSSPIIQRGGISLYNLSSRTQEKASLIHLKDIPESDPLHAQLQKILTQSKVEKREVIFLIENSDIQGREETWKIFQRYLVNGLYFPGESYKTRKYYETLLISTGVEFQHFSGYNTSENVYNFSKMIIKYIIHIEDWGISSMTERQFSLNKVMVSFTYWDYVQAFNKVLCYNNERHKHTWFIKVCAKIFVNPIPNCFKTGGHNHESTIKILPEPFLKLYREYVKISPNLNKLYHQEHICYFQQIEQIYLNLLLSQTNSSKCLNRGNRLESN
ncbi:hypothetical protein H5410_037582 [Solanum commersonii]|uniref:Uncharacterized protein n=1 Tax=Solanum commersonii TaxID=4109 RepID=A0A9J5YBK9_SOLCO|nr:hypothetical protein H5410_037582 [Solanum commersonii]